MYEKPVDLIPKDTMSLFLTDMYIAISAKNTKHKTTNKKNNYIPFVYEKYKIDSNRFYTSNNYYTSKIEDYSEILNIVKNNIKEKNTIYVTELNFKDSIKKAEKLEKVRVRDSAKLAKLYIKRLPEILKKPVIDTLSFYDGNDVFPSKVKEYNHILIDIYDLEEKIEEEEILSDSKEKKSTKSKVDKNSMKNKDKKDKKDKKEKVDKKPLKNKAKKTKNSTENKAMKDKKDKDSIESLKLKKIKAKLKKNALKHQE